MPATWPVGVPYRILAAGAGELAGETWGRSTTDSGRARQRKMTTGASDIVAGNIRMTVAQWLTFKPWRKALGGATFTWSGYMSGADVTARFVTGQGQATRDGSTHFLLVPVQIEIL